MTVNIFIHIGPPKTGTSAIQYCLQNDRARLAENGIFYPKHTTDVNGVSSGNLNAIYDKVDNERTLNPDKVLRLISQCEALNMHTLVLSSEFFFERLNDIFNLLPNARFIAYVRNPLESFESLYNQSVKRHGNTKLINVRPTLPRFYLVKLEQLIEQLPADQFILRAYGSSGFEGGTIITDFYDILGLTPPVNISNKINPSYSFEALEFKRWINLFCSTGAASRADKILQAYVSTQQQFSLLDAATFERYKLQAHEFLAQFCKSHDVNKADSLLDDALTCSPQPYCEQKLTLEQFVTVADYINEKDAVLYKELCRSLYLVSYLPCFKSDFGQYLLKDYQLSEVSKQNMFKQFIGYIRQKLGKQSQSTLTVNEHADVGRLRNQLSISDDFSDADLLREVAIFAETNRDFGLAYALMTRAQELRPSGSLIRAKIKYYENKIDNLKQSD
ncbi:hypothetical protein [Shewanella saliphila]|uniref:Sulfotransferase domain-containing protein n=1 Tax=Shewanella saliphila TaxID=2282698 RepID=A0ABQ2Q5H8_9GAMM|nr:hypothetical protein [Shewanella saliphila]MCL1101336.1 hypothetical protein [Shewanella saliphila]GGP50205.1 hypothetical protein GCM10009409_15860 [Shewanella saliphila]